VGIESSVGSVGDSPDNVLVEAAGADELSVQP